MEQTTAVPDWRNKGFIPLYGGIKLYNIYNSSFGFRRELTTKAGTSFGRGHGTPELTGKWKISNFHSQFCKINGFFFYFVP